jgi:hypothetical protein
LTGKAKFMPKPTTTTTHEHAWAKIHEARRTQCMGLVYDSNGIPFVCCLTSFHNWSDPQVKQMVDYRSGGRRGMIHYRARGWITAVARRNSMSHRKKLNGSVANFLKSAKDRYPSTMYFVLQHIYCFVSVGGYCHSYSGYMYLRRLGLEAIFLENIST